MSHTSPKSNLKNTLFLDIENRLVAAKREGVRGEMEWELEVSRCKLLYIEWINNEVLLYGTGNYIQYPVVNLYMKNIIIYV